MGFERKIEDALNVNWNEPPTTFQEVERRRQSAAPGVVAEMIRETAHAPLTTLELIASLIESGIIVVNGNPRN